MRKTQERFWCDVCGEEMSPNGTTWKQLPNDKVDVIQSWNDVCPKCNKAIEKVIDSLDMRPVACKEGDRTE